MLERTRHLRPVHGQDRHVLSEQIERRLLPASRGEGELLPPDCVLVLSGAFASGATPCSISPSGRSHVVAVAVNPTMPDDGL